MRNTAVLTRDAGERQAAMTPADLVAVLTGDRTLAKYTGGRERLSRDEIARLAYHLFETRGRRDGHDVDDWLVAEQALAHHHR